MQAIKEVVAIICNTHFDYAQCLISLTVRGLSEVETRQLNDLIMPCYLDGDLQSPKSLNSSFINVLCFYKSFAQYQVKKIKDIAGYTNLKFVLL